MLMKQPKISIIVPVYNVEKYLDRCMQSLMGQTLKEIEIILVDDESPDNCPAMCDEYAKYDPRLKVVHKLNGGLGNARNSGLDVAIGTYVAFIDSDDYVELDMMEKLYAEVSSLDLDAVFSEFNPDNYPGFRVVYRPKEMLIGKDSIEKLRLDIVGPEPSYISSVKFAASACKGLYSMELINKYNIRFHSEREYISEDMVFNLDYLSKAQKVELTPWKFYHYCLNESSLSHTYCSDKWVKFLIMLKKIEAMESSFTNSKELFVRLSRLAISFSQSAIMQELRSDKSYRDKKYTINKIISDCNIEKYIVNYPIKYMPIRWRIYAFLLKNKMALCIYVYLSIKKWI